jgi:hypothetical protein
MYGLPLSPLFARFYNILELSFVSPYTDHLLFLAKTNKENDNNNWLFAFDRANTRQFWTRAKRSNVWLSSFLNKVIQNFQKVLLVSMATARHELATERSGMHSGNTLVFYFGVKINPVWKSIRYSVIPARVKIWTVFHKLDFKLILFMLGRLHKLQYEIRKPIPISIIFWELACEFRTVILTSEQA